MVIGTQKGRDMKSNVYRNFGWPSPEGYRKAMRLMQLADKADVPIITLIDTSLVQGQLQNALGYTLKETRHLYGTYSSGMNLYNLPSSMMTALTIAATRNSSRQTAAI